MSWCHIYYITSVILYIYSGYVTASEYYVSAAPNGEDCPSVDISCHNLSYYTDDNASYFTDDTIFYFLNGTHTLQGILHISNVSNITLQGLGHIEHGFHETVMQSTSVIRCSDSGIRFSRSGDITIKLLTVANCVFDNYIHEHEIPLNPCGYYWYRHHRVGLFFVDINSVTLERVSVQNSSGNGLVLVNVYDVLIDNSSVTNNGDLETFVGNVLIVYDDQLKRLSSVRILKSNFTLGLGYGIFLLYLNDNKAKIIIENSVFSNNIGGGGVYINLHGDGSIEFSNCNIFDNTAQYSGGGVDIYFWEDGSIGFSNCTIYNNTAQYSGGGVDFYSYGSGSIEFSNCIIYNNTAQSGGGGGVYISLYSTSGSLTTEFLNCIIYNNTAQYNGGGVYINLFSESGNIIFINCTINYNSAQYYGGGLCTYFYAERGSNEFSNCTISKNTAYLASGLVLRSAQTKSTASFHFTNFLIHSNEIINNHDVYHNRYQSAVVLINVNNITFDKIEVINHNTTGLVGDNSLITFDKNNMFVNNSGIYGGGIALYDSAQLLLNHNTNISFINNNAIESGGGIFVSQALDLDNITDCSFKVIPYHDPNDTKTVLYFVNNTADISGDVLYGGKIDNCMSTLYFDHLFHYPQQTGLSVVSSDPIEVCFCESKMPNCSISNISRNATPGIDVNVSLVTIGLKNGLTQGVIKLNISDSSSTVLYDNKRLNANCSNINFKIITDPLLNKTQVYFTLNRSISEPFDDPYAKVIEITIKSCPIGFPLISGSCVCGSKLNSSSIKCDNKTLIITRVGNMWIGSENDSKCLIVHLKCPFNYCNKNSVSFKINNHNKQCLHGRSGILCGQCSKNLSLMLGSNQCDNCTNDHIALIIPFALAGIALVAFIIILNLTVSVGTINGLIFYANIVKIYEHIFFPNGPIPFLSQFISWVNLDLGINTCFYHSMDSCSKAWLQFVFPVYIWLILLVIIILLRYSSRMVRLVGRQIIPVIATMILLSYAKLIRTVVQALYFVDICCTNEKKNETFFF